MSLNGPSHTVTYNVVPNDIIDLREKLTEWKNRQVNILFFGRKKENKKTIQKIDAVLERVCEKSNLDRLYGTHKSWTVASQWAAVEFKNGFSEIIKSLNTCYPGRKQPLKRK